MLLEIKRDIEGSTLHLSINGVLDYSTIDGFTPDIPDNISKVVVDLSALTFIDSTGIGAVLGIIYHSSEHEIFVEFQGLNNEVKELFDTVGVFRIVESLLKRGQ